MNAMLSPLPVRCRDITRSISHLDDLSQPKACRCESYVKAEQIIQKHILGMCLHLRYKD